MSASCVEANVALLGRRTLIPIVTALTFVSDRMTWICYHLVSFFCVHGASKKWSVAPVSAIMGLGRCLCVEVALQLCFVGSVVSFVGVILLLILLIVWSFVVIFCLLLLPTTV